MVKEINYSVFVMFVWSEGIRSHVYPSRVIVTVAILMTVHRRKRLEFLRLYWYYYPQSGKILPSPISHVSYDIDHMYVVGEKHKKGSTLQHLWTDESWRRWHYGVRNGLIAFSDLMLFYAIHHSGQQYESI